jgi:hypothetical protein
MMEAKTSKSMAFHKTDGGGEYTSNEFKEFRRVKGITHELTCRDTPQQNARAERMNKTLLEKARCLLFQSGLGMTHWGDAVRTAAYLHNRLCGTRTGKVTPVELAFGHKPDLSHLRVFGCAAYPLKTNSNTHKAATRGRKCVLIGYNEQKRGYLLMDAKTGARFTSRDVSFNESIFPAREAKRRKAEDIEMFTDEDFGLVVPTIDDGADIEPVAMSDVIASDDDAEDPLDVQHSGTESDSRPVRRSTRVSPPSFDFLQSFALQAREDEQAFITVDDEPMSLHDAIEHKNWPEWEIAMKNEIESLQEHGVFEYINAPPSQGTGTIAVGL